MNFQQNQSQRLTPFDLVKKALKLDLFEASEFLIRKGYLSRGKSNKPDVFLCTYHDEKSPSLSRDRRFESMKCFGCGITVKPLQIYADFLIKQRLVGNYAYLPEEQLTTEKNFIRWEAAINLCYSLGKIDEAEADYQLNQLDIQRQRGIAPNLKYLETDKDIIAEQGEGDSSNFISRKSNKGENSLEVTQLKIEEFKNIKIGSREELHVVYSLFRDAVEMTRGYRLFDKHKNHLLIERRLTEYEIHVKGYFSHPLEHEKASIMVNLTNLLRQNNIDYHVLDRIPGFRFNNVTGNFEIGTQYDDAFFIPLLDLYGNIHREQLRTNGASKYLWFVVKGVGNCKTPTSTLFPLDKNYIDLVRGSMIPSTNLQECFNRYLKSNNISTPISWDKEVVIIISEGHFKSYELAKHFNCICISIQGLNTWDCSIIALIKIQNMLKLYNKRITKVIIAFDSDTRIKKGLFDNGAALSQLIRNENTKEHTDNLEQIRFLENIECFYLEWDEKLGKGFDDALHNGYTNDAFTITKDTNYEHKHRVVISLISKFLRKSKQNLTTEDLSLYYNKFSQNNIQDLERKLEKIELIDIIIHDYLGANIHQTDSNTLANMATDLGYKDMNELQMIKQSINKKC